MIDAFSRYSSTNDNVGERIRNWAINNLKVSKQAATQFYDFFRCGILHEAHIKQFGQFSFDGNFFCDIQEVQGYIVVNPAILLTTLEQHLEAFLKILYKDDDIYSIFMIRMKVDFENEIELAK